MKKNVLILLLIVNKICFGQTILFSDQFTSFANWTTKDLTGNNPTNGIWTNLKYPSSLGLTTGTNGLAVFAGSNFFDGTREDGKSENGTLTLKNPINCVSNSNVILQYGEFLMTKDSIFIEISTNNTNWTTVSSKTNTDNSSAKNYINISQWAAGQSQVWIRFRYKGLDNGYWVIDDVVLFSAFQLDLKAESFPLNSTYKKNSSIIFKSTYTNLGIDTIKSLQLNYKINGGPEVQSTINMTIPPFTEASISHLVPYEASTNGNFAVAIYTSNPNNTNDMNTINDTIKAQFLIINGTDRKSLVEMGSGAWCGGCILGHYDLEKCIQDVKKIGVVLHEGDGMQTPESHTINNTYAIGYPSVYIDRKLFPGEENVAQHSNYLTENTNVEQKIPSPVKVEITNVTFDTVSRKYSYDINAEFSDNWSGDMRITSYIVEDNVRGPAGSDYSQHNYYSKEFAAQTGSEVDSTTPFYKLPYSIDGYRHHRVVTKFLTPAWGLTGVIPSSVIAGNKYTKTITGTLAPVTRVTYATTPEENELFSTFAGEGRNKFKDITVVAMVNMYSSNINAREVLNCDQVALYKKPMTLNDNFAVSFEDTTVYSTTCINSIVEIKNKITNKLSSPITLKWKANIIQNGDNKWGKVQLSTPSALILNPSAGSFTMAASSSNYLNVYFDTKNNNGKGQVIITIYDANDSANTVTNIAYNTKQITCSDGLFTNKFFTLKTDSIYTKNISCSNGSIELINSITNKGQFANYKWKAEIVNNGHNKWGSITFCDPKACYSNPSSGSFSLSSGATGALILDFDSKLIEETGYVIIYLWDESDSASSVKTIKFTASQVKCANSSLSKISNDYKMYYYNQSINVSQDLINSQLEIYNFIGQKIYSNPIKSTKIDFAPKYNGMFIGNVISKDGEILKTLKFIVE